MNIVKSLAISMSMLGCWLPAVAAEAVVNIANRSGQPIYFQPADQLDYNEIAGTDTTIRVDLSRPQYYVAIPPSGDFINLYITPGSTTDITINGEKTDVHGTNERENRFISENRYVCRAPKGVKSYSSEWISFNDAEICRLDSLLDASGLDREFIDTQRLYYGYTYLNQRLGGLELARAFNRTGKAIEIPEDYYSFLPSIRFDSEKILSIPKWFEIVNKTLEVMEQQDIIPVSNDSYMSLHAKAIDNEKVRSAYLTKLLNLTLKKNYFNDFSRQLPEIRPMITSAEDIAAIPSLEEKYRSLLAENSKVATGTQMPEFSFKDVDGKEYNFSDFRGKYVILDFWFTGCAPCRAEMPYFDKVARNFEGSDVSFISLSVDTGEELYAAWEKMMRENPHNPNVLSVNLPDGFNSPLLGQLNIHGVPRIMLIDREGRIIDSYAKRPSDPKLSRQLKNLLEK